MTQQEMGDFARHMVQLATHAGHAMTFSKASVPPACASALEEATVQARTFYRAMKALERRVDTVGALERPAVAVDA